MLGRLLLLNAAAARAVSFTLLPRLIIFNSGDGLAPRKLTLCADFVAKVG
jgi:hypothetical protein